MHPPDSICPVTDTGLRTVELGRTSQASLQKSYPWQGSERHILFWENHLPRYRGFCQTSLLPGLIHGSVCSLSEFTMSTKRSLISGPKKNTAMAKTTAIAADRYMKRCLIVSNSCFSAETGNVDQPPKFGCCPGRDQGHTVLWHLYSFTCKDKDKLPGRDGKALPILKFYG